MTRLDQSCATENIWWIVNTDILLCSSIMNTKSLGLFSWMLCNTDGHLNESVVFFFSIREIYKIHSSIRYNLSWNKRLLLGCSRLAVSGDDRKRKLKALNHTNHLLQRLVKAKLWTKRLKHVLGNQFYCTRKRHCSAIGTKCSKVLLVC